MSGVGHKAPLIFLVETIPTPIGPLVLTHDGKALWNIAFHDRAERRAAELARHAPHAMLKSKRNRSIFATALSAFFNGNLDAINKLPIAPLGTEFQRTAWKELRRIPAGQTRSYGEQAARIGHEAAARAIGSANGQNPISIVVPCHRLIGANGSLVHYGGGLDRKKWLIDHEACHVARRKK